MSYACWRRLKLPMPKIWRHSIKETNSNPSVRTIKDCFSELSHFSPPACFFLCSSLPYVTFLSNFFFFRTNVTYISVYICERGNVCVLVRWSAKRRNIVTDWLIVVWYNKYICSTATVWVSEIIVFSMSIYYTIIYFLRGTQFLQYH